MIKKAILAMLFAGMLCSPVEAKPINIGLPLFYPHMGVVTKVNKVKRTQYYKVTFRDAEGRRWSWYDDDPSWAKGDFVATIMYNNGTAKVKDDQVIDAHYVGVKKMF